MRLTAAFILTLALVFAASAVRAQAPVPAAAIAQPQSDAALFVERASVAAGAPLWLALRLTPIKGWHTYWKNSGDSGMPPRLDWSLPEGWAVSEPLYPLPEALPYGTLVNYGYAGPATLLVKLMPPQDFNGSADLSVFAEWLACEVQCIPQMGAMALTLDAGDGALAEANRPVFAQARAALPQPSFWPAEAAANERLLSLKLHMSEDEAAAVSGAYFFPAEEGLIDYSGQQAVSVIPSGLLIEAPRAAVAAAFDKVEGVVALTVAGERQGYRIAPELITVAAAGSATPPDAAAPAGALALNLAEAIGFALLGGLLLNLMPCVFPVLSLKAFSLIKARGAAEARARADGLAYTAGILASFLIVAGGLIGLRAAGAEIGWGFQLQSPLVIAALALILFAVGLNLAGLFAIGGRLAGAGQSLTERSGHSGAFFTGVLATVVATPCTVPFMAPAVGFAAVQPAPVALAVFLSLGLGLALPYLMVAFVPAARRILPRPGAWMETFKQALAFPMFLTAVWLLWILDQQAGADAVALVLTAMVALAFAIWLFKRVGGRTGRIAAASGVAALAVVLGWGWVGLEASGTAGTAAQAADEPLGAERWSPERVAALQSEGRPVFVYFTAAWCITCKANEKVAFTDKVARFVEDRSIAVLKADWTNRDAEIARTLERFGRSGVPLYLFYPGGGAEPAALPQILTADGLIATFEEALAAAPPTNA